ncbi:hypothetical protein [Streptomyces sp. NPDC092295]
MSASSGSSASSISSTCSISSFIGDSLQLTGPPSSEGSTGREP